MRPGPCTRNATRPIAGAFWSSFSTLIILLSPAILSNDSNPPNLSSGWSHRYRARPCGGLTTSSVAPGKAQQLAHSDRLFSLPLVPVHQLYHLSETIDPRPRLRRLAGRRGARTGGKNWGMRSCPKVQSRAIDSRTLRHHDVIGRLNMSVPHSLATRDLHSMESRSSSRVRGADSVGLVST